MKDEDEVEDESKQELQNQLEEESGDELDRQCIELLSDELNSAHEDGSENEWEESEVESQNRCSIKSRTNQRTNGVSTSQLRLTPHLPTELSSSETDPITFPPPCAIRTIAPKPQIMYALFTAFSARLASLDPWEECIADRDFWRGTDIWWSISCARALSSMPQYLYERHTFILKTTSNHETLPDVLDQLFFHILIHVDLFALRR